MTNRVCRLRRAFLVSASFPLAALAGTARADQTVTVSGATTAPVVNAQIQTAAATPDRNITVTVTTDGLVAGPGDVSFSASRDQGDGKLVFTNNGKIGVLTAGAVTDDVGVTLTGAGPDTTDNTLVLTNNGQLTGGIIASNFGGAVTVTNTSNLLYNGIEATGYGTVAVTNAAGAAVRSGGIFADSFGTTKTVTDAGVTTTTNSLAGTATVVSDGNVSSGDDPTVTPSAPPITRGDVTGYSNGDASVSVNGIAGAVLSRSFGGSVTTGLAAAGVPAPDKTVTTSQNSFTRTAANATLAIGTSGDVTSATAIASGTSTVTVAGKVANAASATFIGSTDSTSKTTVTQNADGKVVGTTSDSTSISRGPAASISIAQGGSVGGLTSANGVTSASASNAGTALGGLSATTSGTKTSSSNVQTRNAAGVVLTDSTVTTSAPIGGAASASNAAGASVGGKDSTGTTVVSGITATGAGGATISNAGTVAGVASATSNPALAVTTTTLNTSNDDGTVTSTSSKTTRQLAGNAASVDNAKTGTINGNVTATGTTSASVSNAGTIGTTAAPVTVSANANRTYSALNQTDTSKTATDSGSTTVGQFRYGTGTASVTNAAGGLISGTVNAIAPGNVTIVNAGTVRGTTNATSFGQTSDSTSATSTKSSTVPASGTTLAVTTTTTTNTNTFANTSTGGSVTGTYSGANGTLNFSPAADGSITQNANKDSTATISGSVFGTVTSNAGTGTTSANNATDTTVSVLDTANTGTSTFSSKTTNTSTQSAGTSLVTVSGTVGVGNGGGGASVTQSGTTGASLAVSGRVEGGASVTAGTVSTADGDTRASVQTVTAGVPATTSYNRTQTSSTTRTAGAASADISGTVLGTVNVSGVSSAAATVGTNGRLGTVAAPRSLTVSTSPANDSSSTTTYTYARDATAKTATATVVTTTSSAPPAAAGNASATIGGTVGTANVNATRGNATIVLNGQAGALTATAVGSDFTTTTTTNRSGTATVGSTLTGDGTDLVLTVPRTSETTTSTTKNVGGTASITIDSNQGLKDFNTAGTSSAVNAFGVGGAAVTVTTGSRVANSVLAFSAYTDQTTAQTTTYNTAGVATGSTGSVTNTAAGGAATVTNAGTINSGATATGTTAATIANTGRVTGSVTAQALRSVTSTKTTQTGLTNAATRTDVTVATVTPVGGTATVTNALGAVIDGPVVIAGGTGTLTNGGTMRGTLLGRSVDSYTQTTTQTATSTTSTFAAPATPFVQTYTANQNGTSAGFAVTGATVSVTPPGSTTAQVIKTSTINATINLNAGSVTLGNIIAQTDDAGDLGTKGARLTNTTVNLNGNGFLGLDYVTPTAGSGTSVAGGNPAATLTTDAKAIFGTSPVVPVRVVGVNAINKTGAGTFVIVGASNTPTPGALTNYALDIGSLNVNAGELQLALTPGSASTAEFAIRGNIVNAATLVIGRRVPFNTGAVIGNSLTGGNETVSGITVRQVGDYTQTATGTTIVGLTPSLVRTAPVVVNQGSTSNEVLGIPSSGVSQGYFTTAAALGLPSANSRINVTGNLNLAGSFAVQGNSNSLVTSGDGYVLFTYTGTATISSAAVASTVPSAFVKFALTNDTTAKTVSIAATRTSYATGASNPNAVAAATALDTALTSVIGAIRTDATGGAGYSSVTQLGYAQDIANIAAALDYRLTATQATELFNELSSGEIYASLGAVNQNAAFGDAVSELTTHRSFENELGTRLWLSPAGSFARYGGGGKFGASGIRANSYGGAGGLEFAYLPTGAFGFGGGYGEHSIRARGTPERARAHTFTVGAYATQAIGPVYVNATAAYGFSRFKVSRPLALLARTPLASFRGNQFDGSLEVGYDYLAGGVTLTPFGKLMLRHYLLNNVTETNGGGVGLVLAKQDKSVFSPVLGAKASALVGVIRPYAKASYTFQGDIGADRTATYLGGGSPFTLRGVDPSGFGTVETGLDGSLGGAVGVFLQGGYSFGGGNKIANVRAGVGFRF